LVPAYQSIFMHPSFIQALFFLSAGIAVIIVLTTKYRVHAFFALLIACFVVGLGVQLSFSDIITAAKAGFGRIMQSLGLIIVLGIALGVLLEHSGCTRVMANFIIKKTGEKRAPLAITITGFIVGLPVFCDSAYIVLNGLNLSLAKRTRVSVIVMAVPLAVSAYSVHCLIPPHPGAAATMGVEFGKLILFGVALAIPATIAGYLWAVYMGRKLPAVAAKTEHIMDRKAGPPVFMSFVPVVVPVALIAVNSLFTLQEKPTTILHSIFAVAGDPVIALTIGVLLVFTTLRHWTRNEISKLLQESAEKAGSILVIIGAGGAFGAVLMAAGIGDHFSQLMNLKSAGIFFPFLLTFILKTAQGSSTVAIITASSIVLPLLGALGLDSSNGRLLSILAMGAGSMMISHANDGYFWVISKFSGLDMRAMLKTYSVATILMGLVTFLIVYILSLAIL